MKSLTYVEIDVDYCSLTYGVAPCTAAVGVTGDRKCFNTLSTCQDRVHFTNAPVTLRFSMPADYLPGEIDSIPVITDVSLTPAVLSLGEDLGTRASLRVTLKDLRHSDTGSGFDKYVAERPYDPFTQGSFWGKFRARQPYLRGRNLRLIRGLVGQTLAEMETRHFVLESFDGPTPGGTYSFIAKDVLKFADGDRAQAPHLSNGFLASSYEPIDTVMSLSPIGIGDLEYPTSGYAALGGKEVVSFTRVGNVLTVVRGLQGTEPTTHDAQDRVQICLMYEGVDPADIIRDLLVNYADVPTAYIPLPSWQTETATYLRRIYSATIAEPTSVATLVSELIEQAGLVVWWDDLAQLINLQVLRSISTSAEQFTDTNVLEKSLGLTEQPNKRISQVWTYFGKIDPLGGQDDANNYRSVALTVDLEAQTDYGTPAIKKIYSRWIPAFGRLVALRLNDIQIGRFRDAPRRFQFSLMKYNSEVRLGAGYLLDAWHLQDDTGARVEVPIQVTRVNSKADKYEVEAEELRFVDLGDPDTGGRTIIFDSDVRNVNLRSIYNTLYPAPESGTIVNVYVENGVRLYSNNVNTPALTIGTWPAGVIINLTVRRGRLTGRGGRGGRGWEGTVPMPGENGGTALFTRYPINLILEGGEIFGGGGGGGGGNVNTFNNQDDKGGGGGGGGGYLPGDGGIGPAPAENGAPGTLTGGGVKGRSFTTKNWWDFNQQYGDIGGGYGGNVGQAGNPGTGWGGSTGASGGGPGYAIDGRSYVTITGAGDRRGPEVN